MRLKDVLTVKLGGENFEIVKSDDMEYLKKRAMINSGVDLSSCYIKCSNVKKSIYRKWLEWARNNECINNFGISSYNPMIFTLSTICKKSNVENVLYITPSHNNFCISNEKWEELKNLCYEMKKTFQQILAQYINVKKNVLYDYTCYKIAQEEGLYLIKEYNPKFTNCLGGLSNNIATNIINAIVRDIFNY